MSCTSPAPWWRTPSKRRFDRRLALIISPQHQTSTALSGTCGGNRATPPLLRSLVRCFHIHSKTACRASPPKRCLWRMPFNEEDCLCNLPGVGHANSFAAGRRLARRPRRRRQSRAPQEGLRSKFNSVPPFPPCYDGDHLPLPIFNWFSHPASSAYNRCYPLQHPERTRFRLFWAFPDAFRCFSGSNFLGRNLCFLPSVVGSQPVL